MKGVNAADYYPRKAKKERRSGVVIVGVTVNEGEPQPAKVVVAESSSHEDLDKAALRAIRDTTFATSCHEPATIKLKVTFGLNSR